MNEAQTEIPIGIPHAHTFVPQPGAGTGTPTTMLVYGPCLGISKSLNTYGFVADPNGAGGYVCSFLPDELGVWTVVIKDTNGVILHSSTFRAIWERQEFHANRLVPKQHTTVSTFPAFLNRQANSIQITSLTCSGTTVTAGTLTAHGYSSGTTVIITGATVQGYNGTWVLASASGSTFTYTVAATLASPAVAITPANRNASQIRVTHDNISASSINNTGSTYFAVASTKKIVIPQSGYIYGIKLLGVAAAFPNMNYIKFFTCSSDGNYTVRGISEDFHATTPVEGSWLSGNVSTIWFKSPVPARVGDWWGIEVSMASGHTSDAWGARGSIISQAAATQELRIRTSNSAGISLSGSNTFSTFGGGVFGCLYCQPMMRNPAVVLAGHSFYSGFSDADTQTCSTYDYNTQNISVPFLASTDIAAQLEQHLGLPVVNCAVGGSNICDWVGQPTLYGINSDLTGAGWFEQHVAPLLPAAMLFDTAFNDAGISPALTSPVYRQYLDRLQWHCDKYGIELILMDSSPAWSATQDTASNRIQNYERLRNVMRTWAQQNGVAYISAYYRMGQNAGTPAYNDIGTPAEASWQRWRQKDTDEFGYLPNYQGGADVTHYTHWQQAGRTAFAGLLAQGIRLRSRSLPLFGTTGSNETTYVQPGARGTSGAGISGGG